MQDFWTPHKRFTFSTELWGKLWNLTSGQNENIMNSVVQSLLRLSLHIASYYITVLHPKLGQEDMHFKCRSTAELPKKWMVRMGRQSRHTCKHMQVLDWTGRLSFLGLLHLDWFPAYRLLASVHVQFPFFRPAYSLHIPLQSTNTSSHSYTLQEGTAALAKCSIPRMLCGLLRWKWWLYIPCLYDLHLPSWLLKQVGQSLLQDF